MLKIRLQRVGRKHDPSFRVVLTDSKNGPTSGRTIEILGNYDPKRDIKNVDGDKIKNWISKGAQVSDTVHNLLVGLKVIDGKKVNVLPKKSPVVDEEKLKAEAEASAAAKAMADEKVKAEADAKAKAEAEATATEVPAEESTPAEVEEEKTEE